MEEELRLEKDMRLPTPLLAWGLVVKVGEQDKWENLGVLFYKARRHFVFLFFFLSFEVVNPTMSLKQKHPRI